MTQRGAVFIGPTVVNLDFPAPEQAVLPGAGVQLMLSRLRLIGHTRY
jgi:hypothetical protein